MPSDENLASALSRLAYEREPVVGPVVTAALARGRQIRRRRWQAAGSAAAAAVLGAAGAFALHARSVGQPGPAGPGAESPIFRQLTAQMHKVVPHSKLTPLVYPGAAPGVASAVFDDGGGLADLGVAVDRYAHGLPAGAEYFCPSRLTDLEYLSCSRTARADGTVVVLHKGYVSGFGPVGTHGAVQEWSVTAFHPDGLVVEFGEDDTHSDPHDITSAKPTRPAPPLTDEQLRQLVESPGWEAVAVGMTDYANPAMTSSALRTVALRALPPSVETMDGNLNPGGYDYATIVTAAGRTALLTFHVAPNAQSSWPGDPCAAGHPLVSAGRLSDCHHEIRPDGSEIYATAVTGNATDPAGDQWVAGVRTASGMVLEVVETPTGASGEPTAADRPPLSAAELYAVVGNEAWGALK